MMGDEAKAREEKRKKGSVCSYVRSAAVLLSRGDFLLDPRSSSSLSPPLSLDLTCSIHTRFISSVSE